MPGCGRSTSRSTGSRDRSDRTRFTDGTYTPSRGARLAAGVIGFNEVGPELEPEVVRIDYQKPSLADGRIIGNVPILDAHYGNVWTNIGVDLFDELGVTIGESVRVRISAAGTTLFDRDVPFVRSFGGVPVGDAAIYVNDILNMGIAINQGNFAERFGVEPGPDTMIELWK